MSFNDDNENAARIESFWPHYTVSCSHTTHLDTEIPINMQWTLPDSKEGKSITNILGKYGRRKVTCIYILTVYKQIDI